MSEKDWPLSGGETMKQYVVTLEGIVDKLDELDEIICLESDEYQDEAINEIRSLVYTKLLETKDRVMQDWMTTTQYIAYNLEDEDWEHYRNGGCLCAARSDTECLCGTWELEDEFYV